jgi:two-component system response regulator VicR
VKTVLIIEDEPALLDGLRVNLETEGYRVVGAHTGEKGIDLAMESRPDVIVLDVMLPGIDGFEVCRRLREFGVKAPIIILSARSGELDRVFGLEIGADDYVTKPFSLRELLVRIHARLREHDDWYRHAPNDVRLGSVFVDFENCQASRDGEAVQMTAREFDILRLLASHRGQVVTRAQIMNCVFGSSDETGSRSVDTHILHVRQKIEDDPANPRYLLTVYGQGYKLLE